MTIKQYLFREHSEYPPDFFDTVWVKHEDHINMIQKLIMFYGLPRDKQESAEFLGLAQFFKEIENGTTRTHTTTEESNRQEEGGEEGHEDSA